MSSTDPAGRTPPTSAQTRHVDDLCEIERVGDGTRRSLTDAAFERARDEDPDVRRQALEDAVLANLGVARSLAAAHRDKGVPREDLEQVAYTALVAAAQRFRPEEGRDFLAFAIPTIRGELKRHFRDCGWTVRPPRRVQEIQLQVLATRDRLAKTLERLPSAAEIAAELDESEHHVAEALRLDGCFAPSSLDLPLASGSATLGDLLPAGETRAHEAVEARVMLGPALRELAERDRYILRLRYFEGMTQREIGDELGVTQTQVSRILTRIGRDLRECLTPPGDALAS
jgi:RNA polymerase sigma-B factor